jgi:shikimate dehydrogenase
VSEATRVACVMGWPAKQSRSPKLHGYWIKRYNIDGDYRVAEIPPEEFPAFVQGLAKNGFVGGNVTMPHKDVAFALSEPDERARAVGAANTLWLDNGKLRATNTDVEGFIGALDVNAPGWDRSTDTAIVLGAGGASRAVICGLSERGIKTIHVVNRTAAKAAAAKERFGAAVHPATWEDVPRLLNGARLLINASSLGMKGQPELKIDLSPMAKDAVVADIVYVPLKTKLLEMAAARGFKTSDGLDMLLYQAVRGFTLWFGKKPEVTKELRDMLAADVMKST